jgi:hypothetical protein
MKPGDFWPNTNDPAANAAILVVGIALFGFIFIGGILIALPVAIVGGVGYLVYKRYLKPRPISTQAMMDDTHERITSANFPDTDTFVSAHSSRLLDAILENPPAYSVYLQLVYIAEALYDAEEFNNPLPPMPYANAIEEGRYRDKLLFFQRKIANPRSTLEMFSNTMAQTFLTFIDNLPPLAHTTKEIFAQTDEAKINVTLPLIDVLPDVGGAVRELLLPFLNDELADKGLFLALRQQITSNLEEINPGKQTKISDFKGTPRELVHAYLQGTPFEALFDIAVPFEVGLSKQLEHTMIVAGTRWGKSQLIGHIVAEHLEAEDPPGMILMDSTGDFLQKIQRLQVFHPETGALRHRLLIIDPEDERTPSLNMFDASALKSKNYSAQDLEQVEADIIDLFNYVFGALGSELTGQQDSAFSFICRLLLNIDGATIFTLKDILEDPADDYRKSKFKAEIEKLETVSGGDVAIDYFKNQFYTRTVKTTRTAIARRLYQLMRTNVFNRMFSGTNKIDFFEEMNKGSIIVINSSKAVLKPAASALFGRYMIARVLSGAFERVVIKDMNKRKPCLLFIDEAQEYFDSSLDTLLTQIGKFKLGVCIAFQYVDQLDQKLRSSVFGNTTVKYAGGLNTNDVRLLAREMRVSEQELLELRKDSAKKEQWTEFRCFIRNETPKAVKLTVPFYALEELPKMDDAAFTLLRARNSERVSGKLPESPIELPVVAPEIIELETPAQPSAPPAPSAQWAKPAAKSTAQDTGDGSDDY